MRHAALERNRRCILAYLFNRLELLRRLRWEQGSSVLPEAVRSNLHTAELDWFSKYFRVLLSICSVYSKEEFLQETDLILISLIN